MPGPLEGLTILDLTTGVAGPFATKLLADHGARVIKVEPPSGDPSRGDGPFPGGTPDIEASGRFLFLNTNKQSIALDLEQPGARATIEALVPHCDAVVEDRPPGDLARLGLSYERMEALRPGIVLTSVTPWGQHGPYAEAGYLLTDITAQAFGGPMLWTGTPGKNPLRLGGGGANALYQAGSVTALATAMALFRQEQTGHGDHIDISIYETQIGSRDRSSPNILNHVYNGIEPKRQEAGAVTVVSGTRPCKDGYVIIRGDGGAGPRLPSFLRMVGLDAHLDIDGLARDPNIMQRIREPEVAGVIEAVYANWLSEHTKREAATNAQDLRLIAGPVNTLHDLVAEPHFRDRGLWETIDHPHTGPVEYAGRPAIFGQSPRPHAKRAPLLDEQRAGILAIASGAPPSRLAATGPRRLPLDGVRIAEITVAWAGPYSTQLLAEWGAEVIRVEPVNRIQPSTRWTERKSTLALELERSSLGIASRGGYPNNEPGPDPWNRNSGFNSQARNKRSMSCDLMDDEGRAHFLRLIATCDVFIENNVPETIRRMGITYEMLREANPNIIMVRMPAYGLSGPYKEWRSFGTQVEAMVGHAHTRSYPDGHPDEAGDVYTADAAAGVLAALMVTMALRHRQRTGQGQHIEMALAEAFIPYMGELLLDLNMNGHDPSPWGNRHRSHAPHNSYPAIGDDAWVAIEAETDAQFAAICQVLGVPDLVSDPRFRDAPSRKANEDALDALVGARTRHWPKFELFRSLQAAGVPAAPLQTCAERLRCPHLHARGRFEVVDQASTGPFLILGPYWSMAGTPNQIRRGPVTLGQDNEYVYRELIGLSADELADLEARGLAGTVIPSSVIGGG